MEVSQAVKEEVEGEAAEDDEIKDPKIFFG